MMKHALRVFVSSTYVDLKDYRSAVFEALRKAGYQVLAMEDYVATDRRPVEKFSGRCRRGRYLCCALFAFRYGYVPPAEHGILIVSRSPSWNSDTLRNWESPALPLL